MKKLVVDMISESEFTVQGHGVHTAFEEISNALSAREDVDLKRNGARENADVTHIHTIGPYSLKKLLFARGKKVVSVHVIPASFVGSIVGAKFWLPLAKIYLKWFYGRADVLLAVSGMVATELRDTMKVTNRIETFYNTVDMSSYRSTATEKQTARKKLGIEDGQFIVIGNGQVQPRKRLDTFCETAKLCPDVQFIWIGGIPFKQLGAEYGAMNKLMNNTPDNVTITGVITHDEVHNYLAAANAFFLPAEQENHPMCVLEAAGAELPILLRNISEYDDTFAGDALMIDDAKQAAEYISKLQNDPAFYKKSVAMSARIAKKFDSAAGAETAVEIYRSLLS